MVGCVAAVIVLLGARPVGDTKHAAVLPLSRVGVYVGAHDPSGVAGFERWLGARVSVVEDFIVATSWRTISHPRLLTRWNAGARKSPPYRMVYGVPIIPYSGGSLADGATGAYNPYFRSLARTLVRARQGNAILRLGWEFSGGWYPWSVHSDSEAASFVAYWRQIVRTMRAVSPRFRFDWNPAIGWAPFDLPGSYPGNAYVDYIGEDVYDQSWIADYTSPRARWRDFVHGQWSLEWQREFAASHGKPVSFPEWGVTTRPDGHGGGDNPYFVQKMRYWIAHSKVGYQVYFDFDAPDGNHRLSQFPQSAATFRALFRPAAK